MSNHCSLLLLTQPIRSYTMKKLVCPAISQFFFFGKKIFNLFMDSLTRLSLIYSDALTLKSFVWCSVFHRKAESIGSWFDGWLRTCKLFKVEVKVWDEKTGRNVIKLLLKTAVRELVLSALQIRLLLSKSVFYVVRNISENLLCAAVSFGW